MISKSIIYTIIFNNHTKLDLRCSNKYVEVECITCNLRDCDRTMTMSKEKNLYLINKFLKSINTFFI